MSRPSGSSGVIHDIGYRRYQGARLGRWYAVRALFVHNLRAAYGLGRPAKSKVIPFLLVAVMMLPAAGSVAIVAFTKDPRALIRYSGYAVYLQLIVAIFLAAQAPVLASRDLRFHVVPLYFSRPLHRVDYVLAKYGALTGALFALLAAPVTLLYVGALVTRPNAGAVPTIEGGQPAGDLPSSVWEHTTQFLVALVGCAIFAFVLAGIGLAIAAFTPRRGFGVVAVMAAYLVGFTTVSIVQGIALELTNFTTAGWVGIFTPFYLVDGVQVWAFGALSSTPQPPPDGAGPIFALACAAVILGSAALLFARFRKAGNQ